MLLCQACQKLRPYLHWSTDGMNPKVDDCIPHQRHFLDVVAASKLGCFICSKLCVFLAIEVKSSDLSQMSPATYCLAHTNEDQSTGSIAEVWIRFCRKGVSPFEEELVTLYSFRCFSASDAGFRLEDAPQTKTDVGKILQLSKHWLKRCTSEHERCGPSTPVNFLPTRLLYINTDKPDPRLLIGGDRPEGAPYATLSHCWGKKPIIRLLPENLADFRSGIPFEQLPKTFQDAIEITKQLGLSYIWIDALCIIQSSDEDWRAEGARMGDVYKNAFINISAAGARDGSEGCYFERKENHIWSFPLCPRFANFNWEEQAAEQWYLIGAGFWEVMCLGSPLLERGWVFQERLLAKRVLHFGKEQLFWECRTNNCCETFPDGLPESIKNATYFLSKSTYDQLHQGILSDFTQLGRLQCVRDYGMKEKLEVFWQSIVTDYTRCDLTKPGDKLIALSGIAKDISLLLDAEAGERVQYLAGIWRAHLLQALLWITDISTSRPLYRAPSWSWASVDGIISWSSSRWHASFEYTATLLSVTVEPVAESNPFGQIRSGNIKIRGPCWKLVSQQVDIARMVVRPVHDGDNPYMRHGKTEIPELENAAIEWVPDELPDLRTEDWSSLYGLLILRYSDLSIPTPCLIVLAPVEEGAVKRYRRVGIGLSGYALSTAPWSNADHVVMEVDII